MFEQTSQELDAQSTGQVTVNVYDNQRLVYSTDLSNSLGLGRQRIGEPEPYCRITADNGDRLIIASVQEATISRDHVRLELLPGGEVAIKNNSEKRAITLDTSSSVAPGESCQVGLPVLLSFGDKVVRLEQTESLDLSSLAHPTLAPGQQNVVSMPFMDLASTERGEVQTESLVRWIQSMMDVLQRAASSPDFLPEAAQAVATNIGLDTAAVMRWGGHEWHIDALFVPQEATFPDFWKPSQTMLDRVRDERRTFRYTPRQLSDYATSLMGVSALVASPILDPKGQVIGALYGDRRGRPGDILPEISELESLLVELLACGVAAGLARVEQEKKALAARVRFEQFFPLELAREMENDPDMLTGRDEEVSVLVCDICGFSRITERLGPARAITWINDSLELLSECVINQNGVLVDYIGDELMAMWGAPKRQSDHAQRACRAATEMFERLGELNQRWEKVLRESMEIGIGINAGMAQVGNVGSRCKFKYGPLGNTVNVASRIQGATKHLKSRLLISGSTVDSLDSRFTVRRLCRARVVNIEEPVDLYELATEISADWLQLKEQYESALASFENKDFLAATRVLGNVVERFPEDGPTLVLLSRTISALVDQPSEFDAVWELSGK